MKKSFLSFYKIPLLITLVISILVIALNISRDPLSIALIVLGSLLGTFVLDSEYLIYAFFLEPKRDFSKTLAAFVRHGDINNAVQFINYNRDEIQDKTLNSALFQIALAALSIYVVSSSTVLFAKALVMNTFAQSLYKYSEYYFKDKLDEWFWALKDKPGKTGAGIYAVVMISVFVICVYLLA